MLGELFAALQEWGPVSALRFSRWPYAGVNAAHIVGFAVLFGAILPLDLRLMGLWRSVPIGVLARILVPVAATGLALAIAAGFLLFSVRAVDYAGTALFQVKMVLIVCALANALLLHRAQQWEAAQPNGGTLPPLRIRLAGAASIALWLSVIVCGRMIAFLF
ncbi:MAG: DUF6644 family protein [Hyphomicrobiaceae bacterium]